MDAPCILWLSWGALADFTDPRQKTGTDPPETGSDSFDALLRQAAPVQASTPPRQLPIGAVLAGGRLSILRKLGEGGMGVVYEVFDAARKSRVACKTLTRIDAAGVYRLKNEFRALADVRHENLVCLHELFADNETWFFTLELVVGERFDAWVRPENALDEQRLRAALPQLVLAMGAIHGAGKLHRDLKPSNVLVTLEGRVVVLDFGLAVDPELGGVGQTVLDESVSGTPGYMAPEQAAGRPATAASDFYALGVMLFEALTGELPFAGHVGEMLAAKQTRDAPRASDVALGLPARVSRTDARARPHCAPSSAWTVPATRSGPRAAAPLRIRRSPVTRTAARANCSGASRSWSPCGRRLL
jgi:serine/threonine protein kinase